MADLVAPQGRRIAATLLLVLLVAASAHAQLTTAQLRAEGSRCLAARRWDCAERAFSAYVEQRPDDPVGYAMRGILNTRRERYRQAIGDLEHAIGLGEGTWDIFSAYVEALRLTGRTAEAIDWSYRTLIVVPSLVDVRGNLATMLMAQGQPHEALALLTAFDASLERRGHKPYFMGQRISIERGIAQSRPPAPGAPLTLRVSKTDGLFYIPVALGDGPATAWVVDTGASYLIVPRAALDGQVQFVREAGRVKMRLADQREVTGERVTIPELRIGPFVMRNASAVTCESCLGLVGQTALSRFSIRTSRVQGVDFMTLTAGQGAP